MSTWKDAGKGREESPTSIGESLGALTRRLGMAAPDTLGLLFAGWHEIVGSALADHVRPQSLYQGTLTLVISDPAWATHLRYLHDDLIARMAERVGDGIVTEIVVHIERNARRARRTENRPR